MFLFPVLFRFFDNERFESVPSLSSGKSSETLFFLRFDFLQNSAPGGRVPDFDGGVDTCHIDISESVLSRSIKDESLPSAELSFGELNPDSFDQSVCDIEFLMFGNVLEFPDHVQFVQQLLLFQVRHGKNPDDRTVAFEFTAQSGRDSGKEISRKHGNMEFAFVTVAFPLADHGMDTGDPAHRQIGGDSIRTQGGKQFFFVSRECENRLPDHAVLFRKLQCHCCLPPEIFPAAGIAVENRIQAMLVFIFNFYAVKGGSTGRSKPFFPDEPECPFYRRGKGQARKTPGKEE